jgi:hypothetical protein
MRSARTVSLRRAPSTIELWSGLGHCHLPSFEVAASPTSSSIWPSHLNDPIQFYLCFISYNHTDKAFARRLYDALQGRGIRCWLDEKQLLPGDDIYDQVDRGIRLWDKVLLCCSKASLTSW